MKCPHCNKEFNETPIETLKFWLNKELTRTFQKIERANKGSLNYIATLTKAKTKYESWIKAIEELENKPQ